MDSSRSSLDRDPEKSPHEFTQTVIQNAADTMIAVTESYRYHYREQFGGPAPRPPQPSDSHSRSSSTSSSSSHRLLDHDPLRQPSISSLYSAAESVPDVLVPGRRRETEEQSLLPRRESDDADDSTLISADLIESIRLSTPNLPPRLDTPRTPPLRHSHPATNTTNPLNPPEPNLRPVSDIQSVNHGGLLSAARRIDAFRTPSFQYMTLRPDMGPETRPFGTVTHIRAGSDFEPLMAKELRRKPLAPGVQTIKFNHSPSFANEVLFVAVLCLAQLVSAAAFAQALVPARTISTSFPESSRAHLAWYSAAYALVPGVFTLLGTRLGSIFGAKAVFVAGYLCLALWSLLAGVSVYVQTRTGAGTAFFCFCRAMQGLGPVLLIPNGQAMLRRAYPPGQRKSLAVALFDAAAPVGLVTGAVMASLFAGFADWPWAFYSLTTVCLALAALSALMIPSKSVQMHILDGSMWERLDLPALVVGSAGLIFFSVGWNQAPVVSFSTPYTYVLIVLGVLLLIPFVLLEAKARHPLVPVKNMRPSAWAVLGSVAGSSVAMGIWLWYLVQLLEGPRNWSPLLVSAGFVPLLITGTLTAFAANYWTDTKLPAHNILLPATLLVLISVVLLATIPDRQSYWLSAFFAILLLPLGAVPLAPAAVALLGDGLPQGHQGLATGLVESTRWYAVSVGLGMAGALEVRRGEWREGMYFGTGMAGLAAVLALGVLLGRVFRR